MNIGLTYAKGKLYIRKLTEVEADNKTAAHFEIPVNLVFASDYLVPGDAILALGVISHITSSGDQHGSIGEQYGRWIQFYSLRHQRPVWLREGWFYRDFERVK